MAPLPPIATPMLQFSETTFVQGTDILKFDKKSTDL